MSPPSARAIRVEETGAPEALRPVSVTIPAPGPGSVRVRNEAIGVNFLDVYHRSGQYPMATPFVPGVEGAGTIDAVGSDVDGFDEGDRVAYVLAPGAYAEYVIVPRDRLVTVPAEASTREAGGSLLQGLTAHYLTHSSHAVQPGQDVLVHAAAGGVGQLLVQLAKHLGARVFGTVSTEEKARVARKAGADEVIRYTEEDFAEVVADLTGGEGVDVIYDAVGRDTFRRDLDALAVRGTVVLFGQASGPVDPLDPAELGAKSLRLVRTSLPHYIATRDELQQRATELFDLMESGVLEPRIDQTFPLEQAAEAHRYLEGRKTKGKVLLIPAG